MRTVLALALACSCAALADDLVCWKITASPAKISDSTGKKRFDTFGGNDWGMVIEGPTGNLGCAPVEENGGTVYIETAPDDALKAYLCDIDETEYERASDSVDIAQKAGEQSIAFPEGSSVTFRMEPFEPEKDSGPDAKPEGAHPIRPGEVARERVSFTKRDRTDFWVLDLPAESWVAGLVRPAGLEIEWWNDGSPTGFDIRTKSGGYFAFFQGRLPAGKHLLRLRSTPNSASCDYQLLFVASPEGPSHQEQLAEFLFQRMAAGKEVWAFEEDEAVELLQALDTPAVRERVTKALSDKGEVARRVAVKAVGAFGMAEARARLEEIASSDPDWQTKGAAERLLKEWDRKKR